MDFQRQRPGPALGGGSGPAPGSGPRVRPAGPPPPGHGNQAIQDQLPRPGTGPGPRGRDPQPAPVEAPPTVAISSTLKLGSKGEEVKALQSFLGIAPSGTFDPATRAALVAWQVGKGLEGDGIVGPDTRTVLGGGVLVPRDGLTSRFHDDSRFVPTYRATAQSESEQYRTEEDPYAVGAITRPSKEQDLGGKTYGTYQFESYVYRDGSHAGAAMRDNSTVMRFARWEKNPFGKELLEVVQKHGVASAQFDAKWSELTARDNKGFGQAQEDFLLIDARAKVDGFFDAAELDEKARKDSRLFDVVLGTLNQYGGLADGMAAHIAARQKAAGRKLTADEVGVALQEFKWGKVDAHFQSSPDARPGIRNRINREGALFEGYQRKPLPRR